MLALQEKIFYIIFIIFIGFYGTYYIICYIYKNKNRTLKISKATQSPSVTFIIPVYHENKILDQKFENLLQLNYSKEKLELIFVDGGSTDGSIEKIKEFMDTSNLKIILIEQGKRMGFNKAVIDGFKKSTGQIIFIPGAETLYEKDVLQKIIPYFSDDRIGAVAGKEVIININEGLSTRHENAYRDLQYFIREGENNLDTTFIIRGELVAARRVIVEKLINNPKFNNKGCIDACFFLQSKKDGYLSIYEPKAIFYDISPSSFKDSFKQRFRRAATLIQNLFIFKNMMFQRKHGLFGLFIMPSYLLMLIILPFFLIIDFILFLYLNILYWPHYLYLIILISSLIISSLSIKIQSFIKLQIILALANIKLLFGVETQKFEKIESARAQE